MMRTIAKQVIYVYCNDMQALYVDGFKQIEKQDLYIEDLIDFAGTEEPVTLSYHHGDDTGLQEYLERYGNFPYMWNSAASLLDNPYTETQ